MRRLIALALAAPIALAASACGGKTVTTTPTTSAPEQRTTTPQPSASMPTAAPSAASVGDTLNLTGTAKGESLAVTVVKVVDPAAAQDEFSSPDAGKRFVAVQFRLRNTGSAVYNDSPENGTKARDTQGQQFGASIEETAAGPDFGGSVTLVPGDTALGFITFEVPANSKIAKVQFAMASGFASNLGQWDVT
ncbi:DUF4352 domain-containing protein [Streptomyces sp. NPDC000658]|uniref:DUF4352 domain-containing protein n=1 Tax=Streptomyces sp. NPDC000658 TaxID=3154266 RepID=UPI00332C9893